jgi:hypothetical protein
VNLLDASGGVIPAARAMRHCYLDQQLSVVGADMDVVLVLIAVIVGDLNSSGQTAHVPVVRLLMRHFPDRPKDPLGLRWSKRPFSASPRKCGGRQAH